MKPLLAMLMAFSSIQSPDQILLIDPRLKEPARFTDHFSESQIFQNTFPLYAEDLPAVIRTVEEAAKAINKGINCDTNAWMPQERFEMRIACHCSGEKTINVWLLSQIGDLRMSYPVVFEETNLRKAQKQLLDLSAYLNQYQKVSE